MWVDEKMSNPNLIHIDQAIKELKEYTKIYNLSQGIDIGAKNNYAAIKIQEELKIPCMALDINRGEGVFIKGLMEDLPVHNNMVDLIFCSHIFEHTIDPIKTIKEFHRILKPSGFLYLQTPFPCLESYYNLDYSHTFVLDLNQLGVLFQRYGFKIIDAKLRAGKSEEDRDKNQVMFMVKV